MVVQSQGSKVEQAPENTVITFPEGLIGLESFHQFTINPIAGQELFFDLQSTEEKDLGFIATNPFWFAPDYSFELSDAIAAKLGDIEKLEVYVLLTLAAKPEDITVNLLGPVVINPKTQKGFQVLASEKEYSTRHKLWQFSGGK